MDKIYRRSTQRSETSKKPRIDNNRVRNTIINFHVSPQEKELINSRIEVTGLTRAEFFIQSCLYQTILVKGNIRSYTEIKKKVDELVSVIDRNPDLTCLEPNQAETLKTILEILDRRFGRE
ncbi:MAG: hypothetical protein HUJ72_09460 [Blautia sp.]|nr:hypothetical protein [Blautia sp.]